MAHYLPTQKTVETAWDRYAKLCRAVANDPELWNDTDQQAALERARQRWMAVYTAWGDDG